MIEVKILPREIFDAIKYGGLTFKDIKETFPQFPEVREWMVPTLANGGIY